MDEIGDLEEGRDEMETYIRSRSCLQPVSDRGWENT